MNSDDSLKNWIIAEIFLILFRIEGWKNHKKSSGKQQYLELVEENSLFINLIKWHSSKNYKNKCKCRVIQLKI
jgi:hypothetical protein